MGVAAGSYFFIPAFVVYAILLSAIAVIVLGWKNAHARTAGLCLAVFIFGFLRLQMSIPEASEGHISSYAGREVELTGIVKKEPDERSDHAKLTLGDLHVGGKKAKGKLLATAGLYPKYDYGDRLELKCLLKQPEEFNGFDYPRYLARHGIYSLCYYPEAKVLSKGNGNPAYVAILRAKGKLKEITDKSLPEPEASLFSALSLGLKRGIPDEIYESFSLAGLSHIMAISGLHIVLLSSLLSSFAAQLRICRNKSFWPVMALLALFVIMAGLPASAIRAWIMCFFLLYAKKIGRLSQSAGAVVFAACLMLAFNPRLLAADVGFQLSFAAILGIIYFTPPLGKLLARIPDFQNFQLRSYIAMTLSAQIATFPLVAFHFGRVSLVAPLANILVVPVLPFLMATGLLAQWAGMVFLPLAKLAFFPVWVGLKCMILSAAALARMPFSAVRAAEVSALAAGVMYLTITAFTLGIRHRNFIIAKITGWKSGNTRQ